MTDDISQYKLTEQQLAQIESEIKTSQPLTSSLLPIGTLARQYSTEAPDGGSFLTSSNLLAEKYASLRRIRGDGNCYYRAFLYSLCEGLFHQRMDGATDPPTDGEFHRIKQLIHNSLSWVSAQGYEESTIEMFYEEVVDLLDFISIAGDRAALHAKLNEENSTSDYCTWYLRVLTAAQMKSDPDRYLPFLLDEDGMMDISTFCSREVEPMNKECGMVQVAALAEYFGVVVRIECMDGRVVNEKDGEGNWVRKVACHEFCGEDGGKRMHISLLYRPGHYDILYLK